MLTYLLGKPYSWTICHSDSGDAVKGFFEINADDHEGHLEFLALLYEVSQSEDLFGSQLALP